MNEQPKQIVRRKEIESLKEMIRANGRCLAEMETQLQQIRHELDKLKPGPSWSVPYFFSNLNTTL